jgi:hypothetical protein
MSGDEIRCPACKSTRSMRAFRNGDELRECECGNVYRKPKPRKTTRRATPATHDTTYRPEIETKETEE